MTAGVVSARTEERSSTFIHIDGYDLMAVERPIRHRILRRVRRAGWWLYFTHRWPRRPIAKHGEPKMRLASWLLAVTDDRPRGGRYTPRQTQVRHWLGVLDRPYVTTGLVRRDSSLGRWFAERYEGVRR